MEALAARLGVTTTQIGWAYYSGALPKTIDPEPFIQHWEEKLAKRRSEFKPKSSIYDAPDLLPSTNPEAHEKPYYLTPTSIQDRLQGEDTRMDSYHY